MSTTITELTPKQAQSLHEAALVKNRVPANLLKKLEESGWYIAYEFSLEKRHKDFYIVIEFCLGDYCVSICSKKGHWLLERKKKCDTFIQAMVEASMYEALIDEGNHWTGEDD